MRLIRKAVEKLQDVAGGVGGTRKETGRQGEGREPDPARFESEDSRRSKQPGDDLPRPEGIDEPGVRDR
jgi:hypothetical protein